jgi:uncharacterized protein YdaU (DUF1376 family)
MKYQFMPMFWGDFFANTLHLTPQEAGAYLFLIGHAWEHDGKIAVADLRRVARVSNYHWAEVRDRLEPFFSTLEVPNFWYHQRVHAERTKAAEISNKRKEAALQMHSKSSANALQTTPHTTTTSTYLNASLGKGRQGSSPDLGLDYRSPPRQKTDNVLVPLPEKKGQSKEENPEKIAR